MTVKKEILIGASVERVAEVMTDVEKYPDYVPNIDRVEILDFDESLLNADIMVYSSAPFVSKPIASRQFLRFDLDRREVHFRQTEGMLKEFRGLRRLVSLGDSTRFVSEIEFETGGGFLLEKMAGGMLKNIIGDNVETLMAGVKSESEKRITDLSIDEIRRNLIQRMQPYRQNKLVN